MKTVSNKKVILWSIFFIPVGIYFLLRYRRDLLKKPIFMIPFSIWLMFIVLFWAVGPSETQTEPIKKDIPAVNIEKDDSATEQVEPETPKKPEPTPAEVVAPKQVAPTPAPAESAPTPKPQQTQSNYSPDSGVTNVVSGYCNDGTYVTGDPSARGRASACYGHKGWRDY